MERKVNILVKGVKDIISCFFDRKEAHIVTVADTMNDNMDKVFNQILTNAPKYAVALHQAQQEYEAALAELNESAEEPQEGQRIPDLGTSA